MEEKGLSPGMLLHQAWAIFKKNWFFLIAVFFIGYLITLIPTFIQVYLNKPSAFMQGVFAILNIIVSLFILIGWIKICLKLVKGEKRSFLDLFKGFSQILNMFVADLLIMLVVIAVPLVTFFVLASPGLLIVYNIEGDIMQHAAANPLVAIIAVISFVLAFVCALIAMFVTVLKFALTPYFIVDCYEGPVEAMRMSNRASKGVKWDLLSLIFVTWILLMLGLFLFIVGVIVALPILYLSFALAYRELVETTRWQGLAN